MKTINILLSIYFSGVLFCVFALFLTALKVKKLENKKIKRSVKAALKAKQFYLYSWYGVLLLLIGCLVFNKRKKIK